MEKFSFVSDAGEAWSLAISATNVQYLESEAEMEENKLLNHSQQLMDEHVSPIKTPVPNVMPSPVAKPRSKLEKTSNPNSRRNSLSPNPERKASTGSFFSKLFRGASSSPPLVRKQQSTPSPPTPQQRGISKDIHVNKDIPPELQGVSVKELVKVLGESRANGNGVTPPGTPGTLRYW